MKKLYITLSLLVLLLLATFPFQSYVTMFVILAVLMTLDVLAWRAKNHNWKLVLVSIFAPYLLLELLIYGSICADFLRPDWLSITGQNFNATNRPYVHFDSISGYKYVPGITRVVDVKNGTLIYDHLLHVNKQGYCSVSDFSYKKTKKGEKRLMVMGDSYSAGEIADTTWVDLTNQMLAADSFTREYKLYNFSLEASGIRNWNRTFFNEIVKQYDFDGVFLAVYGERNYFSSDLARDFIIKNSDENSSSLGFFEKLPSNKEQFEKDFKSSLIYYGSVYTDSEISHYGALAVSGHTGRRFFEIHPLRPYLLKYLYDLISTNWRLFQFKRHYTKHKLTKDDFLKKFDTLKQVQEYYGDEKYTLFKSMLDYCRKSQKEIWLASVTSLGIAQDIPSQYHENIYNNQLKVFSREYQANFIDGFLCIDSIRPENYFTGNRYTLPGDAHWNQGGEYLYAKLVYQQMRKYIMAR